MKLSNSYLAYFMAAQNPLASLNIGKLSIRDNHNPTSWNRLSNSNTQISQPNAQPFPSETIENLNESFEYANQTDTSEWLDACENITSTFFLIKSKNSPFFAHTLQTIEHQKTAANQESRYTRSNKFYSAHPDFSLENLLLEAPSNLKEWEYDGSHHISFFPKKFIKAFRKKVFIQDDNSDFYSDTNSISKFFKLKSRYPLQSVPLNLKTRYNVTFNVSNSKESNVNSYADITFFNKEDLDLPEKISYIEFDKISRGNQPVKYSFVTKNSNQETTPISVFLFRKNTTLLKKINGVYQEVQGYFYGLGTFTSLDYFAKYKKFNSFFIDILANIQENDANYLLDKEKFEIYQKNIYKSYSKYWAEIPSHLKALPKSFFKDIKRNTAYTSYLSTLKPSAQYSLDLSTQAKSIPEKSKIDKLSQKISEYQKKLQTSRHNQESFETLKNRQQTNIEYHQGQIEIIKRKIIEIEKDYASSNAIVEEYPSIIDSLTMKKNTLSETYETKVKNITETLSESKATEDTKFFSNLKETGILIDDIFYMFNQEVVSLSKNPELALLAKIQDKESAPQLCRINFRITKPVIIRVDYADKGSRAKKVVGGPYCISLTKNSLNIGLLTSNAVHGSDGNSVWVHPHTPAMNINQNLEITTSLRNACLGEASSTLWKAFEESDPKQAIFAAMTWVTSANSADVWGRNYKFFPTPDKVNFEQSDTDAIAEKIKFEQILKSQEKIIENFIPEEVIPFEFETSNLEREIEEAISQEEIQHAETIDLEPSPTQTEEDPYQNFSTYRPYGHTQG